MVGNFTRASQLTVHPDGTESYAALTLCSCSLLGKSGGLIFFDQGSGIFHGTFHGQSMIVSGSGGLSELRGSAAVAGSELSGAGTFVAQVHFE
jgi:hypothetical protein